MTISISSLVIGCGLFFLAGAFTGVSIMCMLSVRKSRRLNANYFVSDSDTDSSVDNSGCSDSSVACKTASRRSPYNF
mgnify:CR=1 FL=1